MDKRGQGLSINAIILIVLGVVVLVVLIAGFTLGWGKIRELIVGPSNNIDAIVSQCQIACQTGGKFSYCSQTRELKADQTTLKNVNCNYLSKKQTAYGIGECTSITCEQVLSDADNENGAKTSCEGKSAGQIVQYLENNELTSYTCKQEDIRGS
jgi:hypothetical protein